MKRFISLLWSIINILKIISGEEDGSRGDMADVQNDDKIEGLGLVAYGENFYTNPSDGFDNIYSFQHKENSNLIDKTISTENDHIMNLNTNFDGNIDMQNVGTQDSNSFQSRIVSDRDKHSQNNNPLTSDLYWPENSQLFNSIVKDNKPEHGHTRKDSGLSQSLNKHAPFQTITTDNSKEGVKRVSVGSEFESGSVNTVTQTNIPPYNDKITASSALKESRKVNSGNIVSDGKFMDFILSQFQQIERPETANNPIEPSIDTNVRTVSQYDQTTRTINSYIDGGINGEQLNSNKSDNGAWRESNKESNSLKSVKDERTTFTTQDVSPKTTEKETMHLNVKLLEKPSQQGLTFESMPIKTEPDLKQNGENSFEKRNKVTTESGQNIPKEKTNPYSTNQKDQVFSKYGMDIKSIMDLYIGQNKPIITNLPERTAKVIEPVEDIKMLNRPKLSQEETHKKLEETSINKSLKMITTDSTTSLPSRKTQLVENKVKNIDLPKFMVTQIPTFSRSTARPSRIGKEKGFHDASVLSIKAGTSTTSKSGITHEGNAKDFTTKNNQSIWRGENVDIKHNFSSPNIYKTSTNFKENPFEVQTNMRSNFQVNSKDKEKNAKNFTMNDDSLKLENNKMDNRFFTWDKGKKSQEYKTFKKPRQIWSFHQGNDGAYNIKTGLWTNSHVQTKTENRVKFSKENTKPKTEFKNVKMIGSFSSDFADMFIKSHGKQETDLFSIFTKWIGQAPSTSKDSPSIQRTSHKVIVTKEGKNKPLAANPSVTTKHTTKKQISTVRPMTTSESLRIDINNPAQIPAGLSQLQEKLRQAWKKRKRTYVPESAITNTTIIPIGYQNTVPITFNRLRQNLSTQIKGTDNYHVTRKNDRQLTKSIVNFNKHRNRNFLPVVRGIPKLVATRLIPQSSQGATSNLLLTPDKIKSNALAVLRDARKISGSKEKGERVLSSKRQVGHNRRGITGRRIETINASRNSSANIPTINFRRERLRLSKTPIQHSTGTDSRQRFILRGTNKKENSSMVFVPPRRQTVVSPRKVNNVSRSVYQIPSAQMRQMQQALNAMRSRRPSSSGSQLRQNQLRLRRPIQRASNISMSSNQLQLRRNQLSRAQNVLKLRQPIQRINNFSISSNNLLLRGNQLSSAQNAMRLRLPNQSPNNFSVSSNQLQLRQNRLRSAQNALALGLSMRGPNLPIQRSNLPILRSNLPIQGSNLAIQRTILPNQRSNSPNQRSSSSLQRSSLPVRRSNRMVGTINNRRRNSPITRRSNNTISLRNRIFRTLRIPAIRRTFPSSTA